ncbi:coiled-coil domain-containing protein 191-like [Saccostrea echinata]|uniref:coiled-coil domain-containing protein 191-like n=1 Tax=Saccostrea echinata TaxID=191078 RepID=UPI002A804849|nr:coiled-coil domain-containing protein 191-like [Saccostrea echinata]
MSEKYHKDGLYRWKRQTDNKVYSRSQKVATTSDIQNWIQKVEDASQRAAESVFQGKPSRPHSGKRSAALQTVAQLREHDTALTEAQDLLSQWMEDKVRLDVDDGGGDVFTDDALYQRTLESKVKKEWDHMLDNNFEPVDMPRVVKEDKSDPYAFLDKMDEKEAVDSIIEHMLNKKLVKEAFTEDLGLDESSTYKDPRTKMELRHKQVKENREKREKQLEMKRREQQARKTAQNHAKLMIMKEEKDKLIKARQEEMSIKKEMARIRKEMQEERQKQKEAKKSEETEKKTVISEARLMVDQQRERERAERLQKQLEMEERQKVLIQKMEEMEVQRKANELKILHNCFKAWYNVVLERRLQIGKARALSDWKLLLRAWNGWRSVVRSKKLEMEARQHEIDVIKTHRNNQRAENYHRLVLLKKYFLAWQIWINQEQERKEMKNMQEETKKKMAVFLEAAQEGKLWTGAQDDSSVPKDVQKVNVDEFFNTQPKRPSSSLSTVSSDTNISHKQKISPPNRIPTQAWQINRRHLNLTPEEIGKLGGGENLVEQEKPTDVQVRKRFGTQPWMNTKYITNNFENRHNSQQKIIKEQQKQLQEQRRMIEDLQFAQQKQMLQQQADTQKEIQNLLDKQPLSEKVLKERGWLSNQTAANRSETSVKTQGNREHHKHPPETNRSTVNDGERTSRSNVSSITTSTVKSNSKYLALQKKMDERAAERAKLKMEREEKRRQMEEERLEKLKAEEEELIRKEQEEKKARIAAVQEKKKQEKLREQRKLELEEKMKRLSAMADEHYLKSLLKYKGMLRFKKLVEKARQDEVRAVKHWRECLKRKVLRQWRDNVEEILREKEKMAVKMFEYLLIKRCFKNWRLVKNHVEILEGRAKRYHNRNLKNKIFLTWRDWAQQEKIDNIEKERRAREHCIWSLKSRYFHKWRRHPEELKKEREREKRRKDMRLTVAALLPDYEGIGRKSQNVEEDVD